MLINIFKTPTLRQVRHLYRKSHLSQQSYVQFSRLMQQAHGKETIVERDAINMFLQLYCLHTVRLVNKMLPFLPIYLSTQFFYAFHTVHVY